MARVTGPLFSFDAGGTLGKAVVFSRWRGRNYVRRHAIPSNPRTALQMGYRALFAWIASQYGDMEIVDQNLWQPLAMVDNVTKLDAMIRDNQRRFKMGLRPIHTPDPTPSTSTGIPGSPTPLAGPNSVVLGWMASSPAPDWGYALSIGPTATPTPWSPAQLRLIVPPTVLDVTITGLPTGVPLKATILPITYDGALQDEATTAEFTPT
jgi:hypothetical protein